MGERVIEVVIFLFVMSVALAFSAAFAVAIIWAVNILGGSLEYNWQTVVAIMVLTEFVSLFFKSSRG